MVAKQCYRKYEAKDNQLFTEKWYRERHKMWYTGTNAGWVH